MAYLSDEEILLRLEDAVEDHCGGALHEHAALPGCVLAALVPAVRRMLVIATPLPLDEVQAEIDRVQADIARLEKKIGH